MATVEVRVSGWVYFECFDPGCTEFPREHPEIGTPVRVAIGKGRQFRYTVTPDVAEVMFDHAETFGEAMSHGVDDPSVGRRVLAWAARERERLNLPRCIWAGTWRETECDAPRCPKHGRGDE